MTTPLVWILFRTGLDLEPGESQQILAKCRTEDSAERQAQKYRRQGYGVQIVVRYAF